MKFQKGQSGNPAGRPRGSRNKTTIRMQALLDRKARRLVNKAIDMAMGGNTTVLRLCMDRVVPPRRSEPLVCEIPPLASAADAVGAMSGLAACAAVGDVTADEAAKLAKLISAYVNALESRDFEERLVQLERADLKRFGEMRNDAQSTTSPKADP